MNLVTLPNGLPRLLIVVLLLLATTVRGKCPACMRDSTSPLFCARLLLCTNYAFFCFSECIDRCCIQPHRCCLLILAIVAVRSLNGIAASSLSNSNVALCSPKADLSRLGSNNMERKSILRTAQVGRPWSTGCWPTGL